MRWKKQKRGSVSGCLRQSVFMFSVGYFQETTKTNVRNNDYENYNRASPCAHSCRKIQGREKRKLS